jgi:hypothetical protein
MANIKGLSVEIATHRKDIAAYRKSASLAIRVMTGIKVDMEINARIVMWKQAGEARNLIMIKTLNSH